MVKLDLTKCVFCGKKLTEKDSVSYAPYRRCCKKCFKENPRYNTFPFPEL
jgi:recombinational DNA repair protein (RecF pathway)